MEFFKRETEEILQQLRDDQISYNDAIAALDVSFAALIPRLADGQSRPLRAVFLANRELAIKEINRQKRAKKISSGAAASRSALELIGTVAHGTGHGSRVSASL
jgi:hypothetical protein